MKLFSKILISGGLLLGMAACEKEVLETEPIEQLTPELAFSTPEKIESSTVGMYDGIQSAEFLSGRALIYVDLLGDDVVDKNQFFGDLPRYNLLATSGFAANVWNAGYNSIARANRNIVGITNNSDKLTPAKAQALIAECKFVRAVCHFYLVNFFGQPYPFTAGATHLGVPVITTSFTSNDPAANAPRNTVKEVYDAILKDLNEALPNLPATQVNTYSTKTRATKAAAAAMLSRVYLYMGDYTNARTQASAIMSGTYGNFSLRPEPNGAFAAPYTSSETIWSVPNNVNDNPNTNNALPQHYFEAGRGDIAVSPTFLDPALNPWLGAEDKRRTVMIAKGVEAPNVNFFYTQKYTDVLTRSDWAPIIRYAEVLLTFAEASARLAAGVDAAAITELNKVRDRAKGPADPSYTAASFANKDALINAIVGERRVELAFEGHRAWDLGRLKLPVTNKRDADLSVLPTLPFGDNNFIFPIPNAEIDKSNDVLVQNPGY